MNLFHIPYTLGGPYISLNLTFKDHGVEVSVDCFAVCLEARCVKQHNFFSKLKKLQYSGRIKNALSNNDKQWRGTK